MKATRYFREQVLRKRPYIDLAWCVRIVSEPLRREEQPDGRIPIGDEVLLPDETSPKFLRVVTLWMVRPSIMRYLIDGSERTIHEAALLPGNGQPLR